MTLLAALPLDAEAAESWPMELADRLGFMDEDRDCIFGHSRCRSEPDFGTMETHWSSVRDRIDGRPRQFEVYAFCEVADALKAGEVFIPGRWRSRTTVRP